VSFGDHWTSGICEQKTGAILDFDRKYDKILKTLLASGMELNMLLSYNFLTMLSQSLLLVSSSVPF
jgi:hypothetical protein